MVKSKNLQTTSATPFPTDVKSTAVGTSNSNKSWHLGYSQSWEEGLVAFMLACFLGYVHSQHWSLISRTMSILRKQSWCLAAERGLPRWRLPLAAKGSFWNCHKFCWKGEFIRMILSPMKLEWCQRFGRAEAIAHSCEIDEIRMVLATATTHASIGMPKLNATTALMNLNIMRKGYSDPQLWIYADTAVLASSS